MKKSYFVLLFFPSERVRLRRKHKKRQKVKRSQTSKPLLAFGFFFFFFGGGDNKWSVCFSGISPLNSHPHLYLSPFPLSSLSQVFQFLFNILCVLFWGFEYMAFCSLIFTEFSSATSKDFKVLGGAKIHFGTCLSSL